MSAPNSAVLAAPASASRSGVRALVECMRPAQWIKNGFVMAPLVFAAKLNEPALLFRELTAFAAFCLLASGIYLWNDSLDWKSDLIHPDKKRRPIPSGRLSAPVAMVCGSILLLASLAVGFALNRPTGLLLCGYAAINILYSSFLKHMAIVDLMCISAGFVLRVAVGATAIQVEASHWLLMCTFLLALFLGIAKRRQELVIMAADSGRHRKVLENYTLPWLDQAGTVTSGTTIVAYALYTVAPETQARFGTDHLIYTLPFVIFGILRYLHLIQSGNQTGNPTAVLIRDKELLGCILGWVLTCAVIIYH